MQRNELMGVKWAGFRKRLGEQQKQFGLTDRTLVRMLWTVSPKDTTLHP